MKIFISRSTDGADCLFNVLDQWEKPLFDIVEKKSTAVRRIRVFTCEDKCVMKIAATPEIGGTVVYNVTTINGAFAVTVKLRPKELSLKIHGEKLFFQGNLFERSFDITDVTSKSLAVHKPEAGKRGRYVLEVLDESQLLNLLGIAICADLLSFSDSAAVCRA